MKPNEMSLYLKRMANAIDASKAPDRNKVINDLRRLIAGVNPEETTGKIPADVDTILKRIPDTMLERINNPDELTNLLLAIIRNSKVADIARVMGNVRKMLNLPEDDTN